MQVLLVGLLAVGSTGLGAQPRGQASPAAAQAPGRFRHYPDGRDLQGARLARSQDATVEALRVEGDGQLPGGFRVRRDLAPVVAQAGANRVFRFGLEYGGVPLVSSSDFVAIVAPSGRLLASRLRQVPDAVDATAPTTLAAAAVDTAVTHARAVLAGPVGLVADDPGLEIWVDSARRGHLTFSLIVRAGPDTPGPFTIRYRVSALDSAQILAFENLVRNATVHVQAEMWQLSPQLPTVVLPLSDARVDVNGLSVFLTDLDGNVVFPVLQPGSVSAQLLGPYADVRPASGPRLTAVAASNGGDTTVHFDAPTEFTRAQTTAFFWTTLVNRWARAHLPSLDAAPGPLSGIRVVVNIAESCNAFSTGTSIHFGRANAFCQNFATPTIIAHEMGHSIHFALSPDQFDGAYSEAFGDTVAALVTDQPCVGPGFSSSDPTSCVRDLTSVTMWPDVEGAEVHLAGEPYGQFAWALRTSLGNAPATHLLLGAAAAGPADIPDAVYLNFVADDDDGLLGTCSPHQRELEAAADSRGLPRPQTCRPAGDNQAPTAHDDVLVLVEDDAPTGLDLVGNDTDPDGDRLEVTDVQAGLLGTVSCSRTACTYQPRPDAHGVETLSYTVVDTFGGSSTASVRIEIASVEDTLQVGGPGSVQGSEGEPIPVAVSVFDPDGPAFSLQWVAGTAAAPAPCTFADPHAASTTMTCAHEGTFAFGVVATQGTSQFASGVATAEILNVRPSVAIVSPAPGSSLAETAAVNVVAVFADGPTPGLHTCVIDWGDGTIDPGAVAGGNCSGSHAYARGTAGARQIMVAVIDPGGASGTAAVTVTITAGGASCGPASGATCVALGAGVVGPARVAFEFSAWSSRGRSGGQLALLDGLRFRFAAVVQSLEVTGQAAVIRGTGALNGRSGYTFEGWADDRASGPDGLRVVVRDRTGAIVGDIGGTVAKGEVRVGILP